jgi:thioredoxin 1
MNKLICSICILLTAVIALVIKERISSAQDGREREIVMLDGVPVYRDTLNKSDEGIQVERVQPKIESIQVVAPIPASLKEAVPVEKTQSRPLEKVQNNRIVDATDASFKTEVEDFDGFVLVDFSAAWCGSCRVLAPSFESLSREMSNVKFVRVDYDACPLTLRQYGVSSIPYLVFFKEGKVITTHLGAPSMAGLRTMVESCLSPVAAPVSPAPIFSAITETKRVTSNRRIVVLDGHRVYEDTMDRPSKEVERVPDESSKSSTPKPTEAPTADTVDIDDAEPVELPAHSQQGLFPLYLSVAKKSYGKM